MRSPHGYMTAAGPGGTSEADTVACVHCGAHKVVKPKEDPATLGGFCTNCYGYVCSGCHARGTCTPFEKRLEQIEARARRMMRYSPLTRIR